MARSNYSHYRKYFNIPDKVLNESSIEYFRSYNFNYFYPFNSNDLEEDKKNFYIIKNTENLKNQIHNILDININRPITMIDSRGNYVGSGIFYKEFDKIYQFNDFINKTKYDNIFEINQMQNNKLNNYYLGYLTDNIVDLLDYKSLSVGNNGFVSTIIAYRFRYIIPDIYPVITPDIISKIVSIIYQECCHYIMIYGFTPYYDYDNRKYSAAIDVIISNGLSNDNDYVKNNVHRRMFSSYVGNFICKVNERLPQSISAY